MDFAPLAVADARIRWLISDAVKRTQISRDFRVQSGHIVQTTNLVQAPACAARQQLKPANEINSAVGLELAAILSKAMAQNPDERYASAVEFREVLRRVGRVDGRGIEYLVCKTPVDSSFVETGETTVVRRAPMSAARRPGTHAITALFIILITAFGVFCRYYPWKLPPIAVQESARQNSAAANPKWQMKNAK